MEPWYCWTYKLRHFHLNQDEEWQGKYICLWYAYTMCQGSFSRTLQTFSSWFSWSFRKSETAIFTDHLSVAVSKNNYVSNTVETFKNLQVTYANLNVAKTKLSDRKKGELVSRLTNMLSICLFLLEVTFFNGKIYLYKGTRSFDKFWVKETSSNVSHFL